MFITHQGLGIHLMKIHINFQVFQSDGTFVGKFGSCGSGEGQMVNNNFFRNFQQQSNNNTKLLVNSPGTSTLYCGIKHKSCHSV